MSSSRDPETGPPSPEDTTEAECGVFQRIKNKIAISDFASYSSLRILLDTKWKDFLEQKKVNKYKFLIR
jgi:hypothetical protein